MPTLPEQGYNVTLTNWRALFAPPGVDEEEVTELRALVEEATATPEWQATVERNYWTQVPLEGEELEQFIADETERTVSGGVARG